MIICRSCGAPIEWAVTPLGKRIPLDKEPVPDGNILVSVRWNLAPLALPQSKEDIETLRSQAKATGQEHRLFKSHFATCKFAAKHRKRQIKQLPSQMQGENIRRVAADQFEK